MSDNFYQRLSENSKSKFYNVFAEITWPEKIDHQTYWMSPELLSVDGTAQSDALSEEQKLSLSRWELVNLFGFFTQGEANLIRNVLLRLHNPSFRQVQNYFYHFIDEENKHMWFFKEFCLRYAGKIYPVKLIDLGQKEEQDVEDVKSFMRILIIEEMGDYFNVVMKEDERLPKIVRTINHQHHLDESRHIAMGRELISELVQQLRQCHSQDKISALGRFMDDYMKSCIENLYNPYVYQDVGLHDGYDLREQLLADPARLELHEKIWQRTKAFQRKLFPELAEA